jgi:N-acetylated-alpha-linked acidic dipeptidase
MKGTEYPDELVIRGNHDAWVNGANDPISGMAALMEARAISELVKQGWKSNQLVYLDMVKNLVYWEAPSG